MSMLSAQFRKKVEKHKDTRMKDEATASVGYPTGFLNFDFMNGTVVRVKSEKMNLKYYSVGIQDGCMCMLIGRSGCGKTTWAVQTAANIARTYDNSCVFHDDIEGGITPERKMIITGFSEEEMHEKYIHRNTGITAENFYERLRYIHDIKLENREEYEYDTGCVDGFGNKIYKLQPTIYILDSLALLMPEKFTEEEELSGSMSATASAKTNSMSFKRIIPMLKAANIILFVINHINTKIDINPMQKTKAQLAYLKQGESLPGGNTVIYVTNLLIRFDDNTKLKEDEAFGIAGNFVDISLVKSRNNRSGKTCTMVFDQDNGFDAELSLFVELKEAGRVNGAGAYLYIGDRSDIKFSQKNFKQKLAESPELREAFAKEVISMLKEELDKSEEEIANISKDYSISSNILSEMNSMLEQCAS